MPPSAQFSQTPAELKPNSARMRFPVAIPEHDPVAADDVRLQLFMLAADRARALAIRVVVMPRVRGREDPPQRQE